MACQTRIFTPLCINVFGEWVYELHNYYKGARLDHVVTGNRFRIHGDYLGAAHNALAIALDRFHRMGLIHRDVRPQNLLILPDGSLALMDCSFVCHQDSIQKQVDSGINTSSEQLTGKAVPALDWYSLAATMFFVATGYPPFDRDYQVLISHLRGVELGAFYRPRWAALVPDLYKARDAWAAVISLPAEQRPQNLSEILFGEHTRAVHDDGLTSVLELQNLEYLVITDDDYEIIPRHK